MNHWHAEWYKLKSLLQHYIWSDCHLDPSANKECQYLSLHFDRFKIQYTFEEIFGKLYIIWNLEKKQDKKYINLGKKISKEKQSQ